ncbi:MAG: hypothetical protein WBG90_03570 [Saonia sp.]
MNRQGLIMVLLAILSLSNHGQDKMHSICLGPEKPSIAAFYISEVIDSHANKENIGITLKGLFNEKGSFEIRKRVQSALDTSF